MYLYLGTVSSSDTSALLPAVLQGEEGKEGKAGYIFIRGVDAEYTASFAQSIYLIKLR
jgi:hypothetical protein